MTMMATLPSCLLGKRRLDLDSPLSIEEKAPVSPILSTQIHFPEISPTPASAREAGRKKLRPSDDFDEDSEDAASRADDESTASRLCKSGGASKGKSASSRFRGVCWLKGRGAWRARIEVNGVREHLGYFSNEESAAKAYDNRAKELNGRSAKLNFPDDRSESIPSAALGSNENILDFNAIAAVDLTSQLQSTVKSAELEKSLSLLQGALLSTLNNTSGPIIPPQPQQSHDPSPLNLLQSALFAALGSGALTQRHIPQGVQRTFNQHSSPDLLPISTPLINPPSSGQNMGQAGHGLIETLVRQEADKCITFALEQSSFAVHVPIDGEKVFCGLYSKREIAFSLACALVRYSCTPTNKRTLDPMQAIFEHCQLDSKMQEALEKQQNHRHGNVNDLFKSDPTALTRQLSLLLELQQRLAQK